MKEVTLFSHYRKENSRIGILHCCTTSAILCGCHHVVNVFKKKKNPSKQKKNGKKSDLLCALLAIIPNTRVMQSYLYLLLIR